MAGRWWKARVSTVGQMTSVFSRGCSASFPFLLHMIHILLSQHYWWESQNIRERIKRKLVPCQVKTSARDNTTPGKATGKYSSDGSIPDYRIRWGHLANLPKWAVWQPWRRPNGPDFHVGNIWHRCLLCWPCPVVQQCWVLWWPWNTELCLLRKSSWRF